MLLGSVNEYPAAGIRLDPLEVVRETDRFPIYDS